MCDCSNNPHCGLWVLQVSILLLPVSSKTAPSHSSVSCKCGECGALDRNYSILAEWTISKIVTFCLLVTGDLRKNWFNWITLFFKNKPQLNSKESKSIRPVSFIETTNSIPTGYSRIKNCMNVYGLPSDCGWHKTVSRKDKSLQDDQY